MEYAGKARWLCKCDCGTIKVCNGHSLRRGNTKSCGCYKKETASERSKITNRKHGEGRNGHQTPEYRAWASLLSRCRNPKAAGYRHYGGRGIKACTSWLQFENFLMDMGRMPTKQHSLDRIDLNGNYEPNNCRWATHQQQARNRRGNHLLTARGRTATIAEWVDDLRVPRERIKHRLLLRKLNKNIVITDEDILFAPPCKGVWLYLLNTSEKRKSRRKNEKGQFI